jgi:DNA-binding transcriptional regulator YiaG
MSVPRRNPMAGREAAICGRLGQFRSHTGLPRTEFTQEAGLDISALVRYEHCRAALKYVDASRLIRAFRLNPEWLATGAGSPVLFFDDRQFAEAIPARALFSEVYDRFVVPELKKQRAESERWTELHRNPPARLRTEMLDYSAKVEARAKVLREDLESRATRIAKLEARLNALRTDLECRARRSIKLEHRLNSMRTDLESGQVYCAKLEAFVTGIRRRLGGESDQAYWTKIRALSAAMQNATPERNLLTGVTPERKTDGMTEIELLLQRLKRALEGVKKGDLARKLDVPLPRLSEWLSGRVIPSGETTLRLLHWVEQQERQPNTLGSASNTTKGKTQVRSSTVYEKTKPSPPKR